MTKYNDEYISIQYLLIDIFLLPVDQNILDISYELVKTKLTIQLVLLNGSAFPIKQLEYAKQKMPQFEIIINKIYLTKEQFNENKGDWSPIHYNWLKHLLFSKAEVL